MGVLLEKTFRVERENSARIDARPEGCVPASRRDGRTALREGIFADCVTTQPDSGCTIR
jgi:hypothetical protein